MEHPFMLIAVIVTVGLFFVAFPVALDAYHRFRHRKVIHCPETHCPAEVCLDAAGTALGAAFGKSILRIKSCSLWPQKLSCVRRCVKENWPAP